MMDDQVHDELDRSAAGLAEPSANPANGQLPFHPTDASVSTDVKPNGDDAGARMAEIEVILDHSAMRLLDKCALVAEWVGHAEAKASVFGQLVHKPQAAARRAGLRGLLANLPYQARASERGASSSSALLRSIPCGPR